MWDTTAGKCVKTLTGHESSVLAILALPSGGFLSGSADATIRRWEGEGEAGVPSKVGMHAPQPSTYATPKI